MKTFLTTMSIIGKTLLAFVIALFIMLVFMLELLLISSVFGRTIDYDMFEAMPLMIVVQAIIFIASILIMFYMFEKNQDWQLGWKQNKWFKLAMQGSLWGIFIMTLSANAIWLFGGYKVVGYSLDSQVLQSLLIGILLFVIIAVSEELMFRGYLYGLINRHFGPIAAIMATSIFFAALHLMNDYSLQSAIPMINLFFAGLLFGISRYYSDGLWVPIGIHFTWNLFQGNIFGFAVSGNDFGSAILQIEVDSSQHMLSGAGFGAEGSIITSFLLVLTIIVLWWWYSKRKALETINNNDDEIVFARKD